jgi:GT2 family glycosyltransferase
MAATRCVAAADARAITNYASEEFLHHRGHLNGRKRAHSKGFDQKVWLARFKQLRRQNSTVPVTNLNPRCLPHVALTVPATDMPSEVIRAEGKFLFAGDRKFVAKGVSYGTFAPSTATGQFPALPQVAADFAEMRRHGVNTVRTYTVPSLELMDEAANAGLRVMVGIPWAQHIAFLDDAAAKRAIRSAVTSTMRTLGRHPAALMFSLGNEIPPPVVRWHGQARVEQFLRELYDEAKGIVPESLLTYVNFPPTEYLQLDFLDVAAFNVYLHHEANLRRYLARLQHVAGNLPLLLAEAGADSIREGLDGQAALTAMQVRAAFAEGACGAIAFAWTDEWWRGGDSVDDWHFGLVDRARRPKPALNAVARVFHDAPFPKAEQETWPKISVVVCAYNAADTLDDCLQSLGKLTYPDYEVILVNDGSRDRTEAIGLSYPHVRVITTTNHGLSAARNTGLSAASGEIVAYTDADVRVDPDWLTYLVQPFLTSDVVAAGGPNVVPPDDPWIAQCVARAPGGPTHVLFDDRIAEHVPGCNIAVRREALLAIGGFNPIYLRAGDDVDVCWRLQARGWKIGFAPAAHVWHHHRASVRAYWRQQVGYGEGEVWLQPHHPNKFVGSSIQWHGHVYSPLPFVRSLFGTRVDAGPWGTAAFPSVYNTDAPGWLFSPHTITWQAGAVGLMLTSLLLWLAGTNDYLAATAGVMGVAALATTFLRCFAHAFASDIRTLPALPGRSLTTSRLMTRGLIAWLHFIQPLARIHGRMRGILQSPEFEQAGEARTPPAPAHQVLVWLLARAQALRFWSETWLSREALLTRIVDSLRSTRVATALEIDDGWDCSRDVSLHLGQWGRLDVQMLVEEHERGKVLVRIARRLSVTPFLGAVMASLFALVLAFAAAPSARWLIAVPIAMVLVMMVRAVWHAAATMALADDVMARVLSDAGAFPLEQPAATMPEIGRATRHAS